MQHALVNRGEEIGKETCSAPVVGRDLDRILAVLEKNIYHLLSIGRCELALGAVLTVAVVTREATAAASASGSTGIGNEDDGSCAAACAKISERFASDAKDIMRRRLTKRALGEVAPSSDAGGEESRAPILEKLVRRVLGI